MAMLAPSEDSLQTLQAPADELATNVTSKTYLSREQLWEVFEADLEQRGRTKFRRDFFNNCCKVYDLWRRWHATGGDGTITRRQMARDLGVAPHNLTSVDRWMAVWVRQGVIGKQEAHTMTGKTLGLRVELRPVSEVKALSRGCSSAGSSVSPRIRIPKLKVPHKEVCEDRVRPWRPRAGRGSVERLGTPVPLFSPEISVDPVALEGEPLKGPPPSAEKDRAARARGGPGEISIDAAERSEVANAEAALERRLTAALGRGGASTLRRAEEAFAAVLGPPPAGRLGHLPTIRELLWVLARLDRYGSFGAGQAGAGISVLEGKLEGQEYLVRWEGAPRPAHLGYFLPALRAEARRWKHTWAPQIKRQRSRRRAQRDPLTPSYFRGSS